MLSCGREEGGEGAKAGLLNEQPGFWANNAEAPGVTTFYTPWLGLGAPYILKASLVGLCSTVSSPCLTLLPVWNLQSAAFLWQKVSNEPRPSGGGGSQLLSSILLQAQVSRTAQKSLQQELEHDSGFAPEIVRKLPKLLVPPFVSGLRLLLPQVLRSS